MMWGRILVLYTGGTIGMQRGPRGWEPAPGFLGERLALGEPFHAPGKPRFTMPTSKWGRVLEYDILEYDPLLDSSNMGPDEWIRIADDIADHDDEYDAFVVLHGTDTMAYTASALSFMLENLRKPVILTGSQIPLAEIRNDAIDNLLGALTIAGHFDIPEVGLYFRNKLLRGNRTQKMDSSGFDAFDSGNYPPLAEVGVDIAVRWDAIRPVPEAPLRVVPFVQRNVGALRIFPGITADTLRQVLAPPLQGLVLETYGSGNAPDRRKDVLTAVREAVDRGVVIVNCTQCHKGTVTADYAAGAALVDAGVVGGFDMTPEAALTKLSWLLGQGLPVDEIRRLIATDLRGELTVASGSGRPTRGLRK
jgi:lysophospholipase